MKCGRIFLSEFKGGQRALLKMAAAAEAAKHALSSQQSASVCIESLHNGMDFQCTVSRLVELILGYEDRWRWNNVALSWYRGKFEGMCLLQFKSFLRPVADVLQACTLTTEEISKVRTCVRVSTYLLTHSTLLLLFSVSF